MKIPKYINETISFKKDDAKKPRNDPKAAFNAFFPLELFIISPTKAPKKGPISIPNGIGDITPIISPTVVPITPYLDPPNFFVPMAGMKKSKIQIINATANVIINRLRPKSIFSEK